MAPSSAVTFAAYSKPVQLIIRDARVVYEPSAYGGDGTETRVNITLSCDDESAAAIRALEGIDDFSLVSAVKAAGVRAKLQKNDVRIYDESGSTTSAPAVWRGARVNAALTAQGTWKTRSSSGISLVCTALQLLPEEPVPCPF